MAALTANPGTCGTRAAPLNKRAPTATVTHPYINRTESGDLYALHVRLDGGNIPHPVRPKVTRWPATARAGIHLPSIGCTDDLATAVKHDGQGSNS
jgi:hypothetical protein